MLPSIFLSRSIKQVSILMYVLSRIVVARRPVRQPHKPGNYEACAEALGQFIGDCIAADSCAALVDELPLSSTSFATCAGYLEYPF